VTALSIVAAATLVGGVLLSAKAGAQGGGFGRASISTFGPTELLPAVQRQGADHILIGLLLPAVQRAKLPFRVQVVTDDLDFVVPVDSRGNHSHSFFDVFETADPNAAGGFVVHVLNTKTGEEVVKTTSSQDVTVRLLPAVQSNGRFVNAFASSATVSGQNVQFGDGSVVPSPFRYALPAVQDQG